MVTTVKVARGHGPEFAQDDVDYADTSGVQVNWKSIASEDGITQADAERQAFKLLQAARALRAKVPEVIETVLKTNEDLAKEDEARRLKKLNGVKDGH